VLFVPFVVKMLPSNIKALILDMDGVIWKADAPIGDLAATFRRIRERGLKYVFATNNSTRTSAQYVARLTEFGVDAEPWQVVTSSQAAARAIAQTFPQGAKVLVIGEDGLRIPIEQEGLEMVALEDASRAQVVVMGMDRGVTFEKLSEATLLIRRGVPFYATNTDKTFPTPRGQIPGAGAWISVITTATNVQPIVAGKPFPFLMDLSLERLGTKKEDTLVVGDRLETDIAAGQAVGCPTALVLSGVSTREEAASWNPTPDVIVADLSELLK
jgi:4-nitrophenyl phosphatase